MAATSLCITGCIATGVVGTTTVIGALGFTALGPAAGTVAAWAQSCFFGGAVPAGGWFATLQSVGMAGLATQTKAAVVAACTAACAAAGF